jgi:dihydrofolate reductase
MATVTFDISLSLDGFITGPRTGRPEEPLGDGGERLHAWAFRADDRDRKVMTDGAAGAGAVICGRRTYDDALPWWGADGPTGPARLPVFVVPNGAPDRVPDGDV